MREMHYNIYVILCFILGAKIRNGRRGKTTRVSYGRPKKKLFILLHIIWHNNISYIRVHEYI